MTRPCRIGFSLLAAFFAATFAVAASRYRIELSDGSRIVSVGRPVPHGTVLTFQPAPGGPLTGVPREMVVRVVPDRVGAEPTAMTVRGTRLRGGPLDRPEGKPLEPGEVLVIGPTGDGIAPEPAAAAGASNPNAINPGMGVGAGAYGGAPNSNIGLIGPDGLPRVASSTDLSRALAASPASPAVGANGFPAAANGAPTVIGPNGTPTLAPGVPGSGTMVIGPNGTPVTATGTTPTVIGPNGTPVIAPSGQPAPAAAQPVIGPNGTPVLAQPGQPGSAAPVIGPNGTPVLAPSGQPGSAPPATAPNGTPAGASPSGGAASGGASPGGGS